MWQDPSQNWYLRAAVFLFIVCSLKLPAALGTCDAFTKKPMSSNLPLQPLIDLSE